MSTARETKGPQDGHGADFELFRATGDVDALARVVDGVTPRLLTLAARRSRNQADAEDLVQATFLVAIQHRDRWDSSRELMPWLAGILIHQAQNLGRRERVRSTMPLMSDEALADATVDPQHLASLEDDRGAVLHAVGQLGEPYRELLKLRVEKGLNNQDLARTLGRPEGTIRVQLARGRERLEALLPKELRLAGLLAVQVEAVQARLRDQLVSSSGRMLNAGAKPVGAAAGGSVMVGKAWGLLAAVLVGVGLWFTLRTESSAASEAQAVNSAQEVAAAEGKESSVLAESEFAPEEGDRVPVEQSEALEQAALRIHVTRSAGNEQVSAPGVSVYLASLRGRSMGRSMGRTAVSDEDGIAEFLELSSGRYAVSLGPSAAEPTVLQFEDAETMVMALPDGVDVTGAVVGFDGSAVPGADIYRVDLSHPDGGHWIASTDAAGMFAAVEVTPGAQLVARAAGHQPPGGRSADHRGRVTGVVGETQEMEIELGTRGHPVSGQVLGPDGQPSPFALVIFAVHEAREMSPMALPR